MVLDNVRPFNEAAALRGGSRMSLDHADQAALSKLDGALAAVLPGLNAYLAGLDDVLGLQKHASHPPAALFRAGDTSLRENMQAVFDGVARFRDSNPVELSSQVADTQRRLGEAVDDMSARLGNPDARPDTFGCRFADGVSGFEAYGSRAPSMEEYRDKASQILAQDSALLVPLPDSVLERGSS